MIQYATLTVVRNEEKAITECMTNIFNQSIEPNHIVVVDDGSTDKTLTILNEIKKDYSNNIKVIKRHDRGFSALNSYSLYLLADAYNSGLKYLQTKSDWKWLIIIPADCLVSKTYAEYLLNGMTNIYGVASGSPSRHKNFESYRSGQPTGGGMVISRKVLNYMGGLYPRNNDYEFSVVHCSRFLGLEIGRFEDVVYYRRRLSGSQERQPFISWGRAMKDANYHPIYVMGRIIKELFLKKDFNKGLKLLVGYLAQSSRDYPDYSIFLRHYQQFTIRSGITRILSKLRLL